MKKRIVSKLLLIGLISPFIFSCSSIQKTSSSLESSQVSTSEKLIQKLVVDDSKVKVNYVLNEKLDLSLLVVKVKTFKDNLWDEGVEIKDYTSSIKDGTFLTTEGEIEITISYQNFSKYSFVINVIDNTKYLSNSAFSLGSLKYGDNLDLNMKTIIENNENTTCLDPLGRNNRILVVPYYFIEDEDKATEENRQQIEDIFFGSEEVAKEHNAPYSVKSYYEASSYGKTTFEGDVLPWIKSSYGSYNNISDGGMDACKDIKDIYIKEYAKANHGILGESAKEWKYYDGNKDGMIDCLWIIYSKDQEHIATNQWWAYTSHSATNDKVNYNVPVVKTMCWASLGFANGNYDPHTYVHETGHAYGLADYYCYNSSWSPMGGVDMMDNNSGDQNAFSKYSLGWASPLVVDKSSIITLKPFTTSGESILLPSQNYNGTAFDEYLLLQYDCPIGLNEKDYVNGSGSMKGYTSPGIRLMHVDARTCKNSDKKNPLQDNPYNGDDLLLDNSKFGRYSEGNASRCTTDYWEGSYNPSNNDRSYSLISVIPASYDEERNIQTQHMYCDNSSLFRNKNSFSLENEYYNFLPSYSSLWNKARSHNGNEIEIDETKTINYEFEILDQDEDQIKVLINVI